LISSDNQVTAFIVELVIIGTSAFIKPTYARRESKTLKEWSVPSVKGLNLDPGVERMDCSDKFSGKETKLEWYLVNGEII
jgi:hypothetical protein